MGTKADLTFNRVTGTTRIDFTSWPQQIIGEIIHLFPHSWISDLFTSKYSLRIVLFWSPSCLKSGECGIDSAGFIALLVSCRVIKVTNPKNATHSERLSKILRLITKFRNGMIKKLDASTVSSNDLQCETYG